MTTCDGFSPVRSILFFILIALSLVGCGPDPAKQALLEQLVTTQSAITAGVTQVTLRDREIGLRTAAGLANDHPGANGIRTSSPTDLVARIGR